MKILLTAFQPFGSRNINFSTMVLNRTEMQENLEKMVLPVEYCNSFFKLKEKIVSFKPDFVILMGEAIKNTLVAFETTAINKVGSKLDNKSFVPEHNAVIKNGENELYTPLDFEAFKNAFNKVGLLVEKSNYAGDYVCNALYYQTLKYIKDNALNIKCVFVHVPNITENNQLEKIAKGITNYLENIY